MKFQIHRFWRDDFKNFVKDEGVIVSRLKKISREREALVKEAVHWLLFRYRVGGRIRGEPGAARALSVVVLITASYPGAQAGSNLPLSPPPFPISSSNGPPSISFLPSYFFLPSPRFSPHPAHFLLPHISLAASWLTCEPSWITGEQSH